MYGYAVFTDKISRVYNLVHDIMLISGLIDRATFQSEQLIVQMQPDPLRVRISIGVGTGGGGGGGGHWGPVPPQLCIVKLYLCSQN